MNDKQPAEQTIERLGIRYGLLMSLALAGYFFLMKAWGLEHNLELRAFNLLVLSSFVLMAIKRYKQKRNGDLIYLRGLGVGLLTSVVGTICFAMMVILYITVISPGFMEVIQSREPFGNFLNPFLVGCTIVIEGIASGFLATFGIMQYYKPSRVNKAVRF